MYKMRTLPRSFVHGTSTDAYVRTVGRKEISIVDSDAKRVLLWVANRELHGMIPLGVQCVVDHFRFVLLCTHRYLTVRVAFTCGTSSGVSVSRSKGSEG